MKFYNTYAPSRVPDGYDCSKTNSTGKAGNITKYCLESRYEACVMDALCPINGTCTAADQLSVSNFLNCGEGIPFTTKHMTSFADLPPCAKKYGIDGAAIAKCAASDKPLAIIKEITADTKAASPAVQYFPDVRVNGKQCQGCAAKATLIKTICAAVTGVAPMPSACSAESLQALENERQA